MGNCPPTATSLRRLNGDHSYDVRLGGPFASILFGGREVNQQANGEIMESWRMSYLLGISSCYFDLFKVKGNTNSPHHHVEKLVIEIQDGDLSRTRSYVTVQRAEAGVGLSCSLEVHGGYGVIPFPFSTTSTANPQGGIAETSFSYYWRKEGRWRVLLVFEAKRKSKNEKPYMVTVSHYLAYSGNGEDFGLSVAVKSIRMSDDGRLDFAVDGPQQHPATALFYMFDQVHRTRTWPTSCPHCASSIIQRQRSMSGQSDSKDSDKDNVPTAPLHGSKQNAGGILANDGVIKGNNNGNLSIKNLILGLFRGR